MTIAEVRTAGKRIIASDYGLFSLIILACCASFWLGLLTGQGMRQGSAKPVAGAEAAFPPAIAPVATSGAYVASKNGTKYYLPDCPGALRISDQNKVWFASKDDAEAEGYQPAANCVGP